MKMELRGNSVHFEGYVNVVERDSRMLFSPTRGKFVEQVRAKTFQRALESATNVDFLFNHNENRVLGCTAQQTIQLWEDNIGLRAVTESFDPEIVEKARNHELRGWSFAFRVIRDHWETDHNGIQRRFLEEIVMPEVSILDVTPAYVATSVEVRSDEQPLEYRYSTKIELSTESPALAWTQQEIELMKLRQVTY